MKRILIVLCLLATLEGQAGMPKILHTTLSQMIRSGPKEGVIVGGGHVSINKKIWLEDYFHLTQGTGVSISGPRELSLSRVRMPIEVQNNPQYAEEFLRKATGIKQDPDVVPGSIYDSWDVVRFRTEKLLVNSNEDDTIYPTSNYIYQMLRTLNLRQRNLEIFLDETDELVFLWKPREYREFGHAPKFTVGAMVTTLAGMGASPSEAHALVINEASLWIYPSEIEPEIPVDPIAVQFLGEGLSPRNLWYVVPLLDDVLRHEAIQQPLEGMNDGLIPFIDWMDSTGIDWSGTISELPFDFWRFGDRELRARVEYDYPTGKIVYNVNAQRPVDILEWVSLQVRVPIIFDLAWYEHNIFAPPFLDADIVHNRPLIPEGGYSAMFRSHTVLEGGTYRFTSGSDNPFSILVIYNAGGDNSASIHRGEDVYYPHSAQSVQGRVLFNNLLGEGRWTIQTTGRCEVQIYENVDALNIEDQNQITQLEWSGNEIQVYGLLDRSHRRNTYLLEFPLGSVVSVGVQPFSAPVNATDYKVRVRTRKAAWPHLDYGVEAEPTDTIPETFIQQFGVPWDPAYTGLYYIDITTEHSVKDLDYILVITRGGLDVQNAAPVTGTSVIGRVQ